LRCEVFKERYPVLKEPLPSGLPGKEATMNKEVYKKLRSHLHEHPLGFPETENEIEMKILERLFSEEEAEMALHLTPRPETANENGKTYFYK
jgi:hypothetical protein